MDTYSMSIDDNGTFFNTSYVDENGKPIERTPISHPYSYDAYVIWGKKDKKAHAVYTDRLLEWDWGKHDRLCMKHFGNKGQYWENRDPKDIQAWLRDYNDNQKLILTMVMQCCNVSSGYPIWVLFYKDK